MVRDKGFYILIVASLLLIVLLITGQVLSLFDYDFAVSMGLQESEEEIGRVGIAFAKGFAFGDTIIYVPMLILGVIGLWKKIKWAIFLMLGSLAISIYWPVVHLYAIFIEQQAINLHPEKYFSYPITLSIIILYGIWGFWYVITHLNDLVD